MNNARRSSLRWLLVLVLVVLPLVELFVLVQVGQVIGAGWTILLLVLTGIAGGWLIRREGSKAWRALTQSLRAGQMPAKELADGALVILAGALMLSPGFVTDAFALLLILPGSRAVCRRLLTGLVASRVLATSPFGAAPQPRDARRPGPGTDGSVIRGEVVDP
ncbi:FxsA family protein [Nocardioides gilvus]|uniref:FxsA family protein n=1 Tax=Nocardioides gilvus TaxID=1735589 RepID=UPI000D74D0A3|nr:FxsA family protein [Nocardioides gilvus]